MVVNASSKTFAQLRQVHRFLQVLGGTKVASTPVSRPPALMGPMIPESAIQGTMPAVSLYSQPVALPPPSDPTPTANAPVHNLPTADGETPTARVRLAH